MRKLLRVVVLCTAVSVLNISATTSNSSPTREPNLSAASTHYIERFKDLAMFEQLTTGIPASIKLGQALVESQAGESELALNANNHFGLKCRTCSSEETYMKTDDERDKKTNELIYSKFQRFSTPEDSYAAHSRRLTTEPRYRSLFKNERTDYRAWARGLQKCGYATAQNYAEQLISVIEKYNLQRFDKPSFLAIPEIAHNAPPQYMGDDTALNQPYDSDPNAMSAQYSVEQTHKEIVQTDKAQPSMDKKMVHNYCTESTYTTKEGKSMQFTLYEVTLEEANEDIAPKNVAPKKQQSVLIQPVQRSKGERLPK